MTSLVIFTSMTLAIVYDLQLVDRVVCLQILLAIFAGYTVFEFVAIAWILVTRIIERGGDRVGIYDGTIE